MAEPGAIGRNIAALRTARGLSQNALARRAGISQAYISALEGGARRNVTARVLLALARALECNLEATLAEEAAQ